MEDTTDRLEQTLGRARRADERRMIVLWTLAVCGTAGVVSAVVRAAQSRRSSNGT